MTEQKYTTSFLARFWVKVDKNGPVPVHCPELGQCWMWIAGIDSSGYEHIKTDGGRKFAKIVSSHRVAYELTNGSFDEALKVLHSCDNPLCCNPAHLFLGTQTDNTLDMKLKGRGNGPRGENNSNCTLTYGQVLEIRRLYRLGMTSYGKLALQFSVTKGTIRNIVLSRTRHLS